jgi:hypothetical protein
LGSWSDTDSPVDGRTPADIKGMRDRSRRWDQKMDRIDTWADNYLRTKICTAGNSSARLLPSKISHTSYHTLSVTQRVSVLVLGTTDIEGGYSSATLSPIRHR